MGTESPSPANRPARARAVKRANAAVDTDATVASVTSVTGAACDSDACVERCVEEVVDAADDDVGDNGIVGGDSDGGDSAGNNIGMANAIVDVVDAGDDADTSGAVDTGDNADVYSADDATNDADADERREIESFIESDASLAPTAPSQLLVAPRVLDAEEVIALLQGLTVLLEGENGDGHEPHATSTGCDRRDPKLPPLAWLFPYHAGAGRPARDKQGHHLRARRGAGKKARPAPRQAQGSLFGDRQRGEAP
jgi:hypothetical protein